MKKGSKGPYIKHNSLAGIYRDRILPTRRLKRKLNALYNKLYRYVNYSAYNEEAEYHNRINDNDYNARIKEMDNLTVEIIKLNGF